MIRDEDVILDPEVIRNEDVIVDREPIYYMSRNDKDRVRNSFNGDPLNFIASEGERDYVRGITEQMTERDIYRKKMALAAYFTMENPGSNFNSNLENMDVILEKFYKKKMTIDAAYADLGKVLNPGEGEEGSSVAGEHLDALAAGLIAFSAKAGSAYMKLAKWGLQLWRPLIWSDRQKVGYDAVVKVADVYGKEIRKQGQEITSELDKESGANPNFIADLVTGDFENVSVTDFTKALVRSSPDMAFQIMLAAAGAGPLLLPSTIGVTTVTDKSYEVEEKQPGWSAAKKAAYIGLSAVNEALFEYVTGRIVKGGMNKEMGAKIISQGLWKYVGKSFGKEGGTEGLQQLNSNVLDLLFDLEGDADRLSRSEKFSRVMNGVGESTFIGGVWGVPEGFAGYYSSRDVIQSSLIVKKKHRQTLDELIQKENLTAEESKKLENSKRIVDTDDARQAVMLDFAQRQIDAYNELEEILESEEYKIFSEEAADTAYEEDVIDAVKAERNYTMGRAAEWNIEDTVNTAAELAAHFPAVNLHVLRSAEEFTPEAKKKIEEEGFDANRIRAWIDGDDVYLAAQNVRPSDVARTLGHEIIGHKGLRGVFGDKFDTFLDGVYRDHAEEILAVAKRYNRDTETVEDQRYATEEFLADCADAEVKPSWWKEFLGWIRAQLRKIMPRLHFTDADIEAALSRSARAVRKKQGDEGVAGNRPDMPDRQDRQGDVRSGTEASGDGLRFSVIGERGARYLDFAKKQNNMANLQIAKEMVASGKDSKTIKLATGWEMGGDGKWRMEIPDIQIKPDQFTAPVELFGRLGDIVDAPALFSAYHSLKDVYVITSNSLLPESVAGRAQGSRIILNRDYFATEQDQKNLDAAERAIQRTYEANELSRKNAEALGIEYDPIKTRQKYIAEKEAITRMQLLRYRRVLIHEIQHLIQSQEGFARGSNVQYFIDNPVVKKENKELIDRLILEEGEERKKLQDYPELQEYIDRYMELDAIQDESLLTDDHFDEMGELDDKLNKATNGLWENFLEKRRKRIFAQSKAKRESVNPLMAYQNTAGEVEARNAERRSSMTEEEKRNSLLRETEDVAEESKIYLMDGESGDGLRFSLAEYSEEDQRDIVAILKPFTGAYIQKDKEDYQAYLKKHGVDIPLKDAWSFALEAAKQARREAKKRADQRRDAWLYENIPLYREAVDFAGENFIIKPSNKFRTEAFTGSWISPEYRKYSELKPQGKKESDKQYQKRRQHAKQKLKEAKGMWSDELAGAIARRWGRDSLDVEQELIDFFRDLKKPDLYKYYTDWKQQELYGVKELERAAKEEFLKNEQAEVEDTVVEILSKGQPVTEEYLNENKKVYQELYRQVMKREAPSKIGKADLEALNATLTQEGHDASGYAAAYKDARKKSYEEFQERLRAFREKVMQKWDDLTKLQYAAAQFAKDNLEPEYQGEFIRDIVSLAMFPTSPSGKYPRGHRQEKFMELMEKMTKRQSETRKSRYIEDIKEMLKSSRIKRNYKGIPVSILPSEQATVDRIQKIMDLDIAAVSNSIFYNNSQIIALESANAGAEKILPLQRDNELLQMFGVLDKKDANVVEKARDFLKEIIQEGKSKFKESLEERKNQVEKMQADALHSITFGTDILTKDSARRFLESLLRNSNLMTLMRLTSGMDIDNFDASVFGTLYKEVEDSTLKEATLHREMQNDFDRALETYAGIKGKKFEVLKKKGEFFKMLNEKVDASGVFIDGYTKDFELAERKFSSDGQRELNKVSVPIEDRVYGNKVIEGARTILNRLDNGEEVLEWKDIDLTPVTVSFLRQQLADWDSGVKQEYQIFGNTKDDAEINRLIEEGNKEGRLILLGPVRYQRKSIPIDDYYKNGIINPGARSLLEKIHKGEDVEEWNGFKLNSDVIRLLTQQLAAYDSRAEDLDLEFTGDKKDDAKFNKLLARKFEQDQLILYRKREEKSSTVELSLSQGTALQLLLTWEQEDYKPNMLWNGWTEESIDQLKKFIKPEVLQLGYWMRDYIKSNSAKLDAKVLERYGAHLPEKANYFPGVFRNGSANRIQNDGVMGRGSGSMSINPNFLIARKFHLFPVDLETDAFSVFMNNQLNQAHFLSWSDTIRDLQAVYNSKDIKQAIENHYGLNVYNNLVDRISVLANGGVSGGHISNLVGKLYKYWVPAKMISNISSVIKQMAGMVSYVNDIPVADFLEGVRESYNPNNIRYQEFVRWAMNSDYMKNRLAGGMDRDLNYLLNHTKSNEPYSPLTAGLLEVGMIGTRWADKYSVLHGGYAVYRYALNQAEAAGMSDTEAVEAAQRAWMRATDETQQSGALKDMNYYQSNAGFGRLFTTFMSNPIQTMNLEIQAIQEYRFGGKTKMQKEKMLRRIVVNHLVVPTLMMAVTDMIRNGFNPADWWDDTELEDYLVAWILGSYESYFLFGKFAVLAGNKIADKIFDRPSKYTQTFSAVPVIDDGLKAIDTFDRIMDPDRPLTEKELAEGIKATGDVMMISSLVPSASPVGPIGAVVSAIGAQGKRLVKWFSEDEK